MKTIKIYKRDEVAPHNKLDDFWVIFYGKVLNLTPFIQDRLFTWNCNLSYLAAFGGKDISHFFYENGEPITEISGRSGVIRVVFTPILETARTATAKSINDLWTRDPLYHIGNITACVRTVRIVNTFINTEVKMVVNEEDTLGKIFRMYKNKYNHHASSYLWRKFVNNVKTPIDFSTNLTGNGFPPDDDYLAPSIFLYFTDDFTVA
ncbi:cytochrome b5 domain-containing protein 1 [Teleopsis dalmanni]|uniref:cytochrome b5 domain-containing protein 1 n=1 Tax=Teleopsis dalmanni TaxID=139649 RepID=UPI0018CD814B|nr:cytochrome b5 domain-containing protein 1 [Teleopsis dalmanni]